MIYVRRVGPLVLQKRQRYKKRLKFFLIMTVLMISITLVIKMLQMNPEFTLTNLVERSLEQSDSKISNSHHHKHERPKGGKCGLPAPCHGKDFAFRISSGATSIVGPQICFDGQMIIKKEIRGHHQGINIAVVNEKTGEHIKTGSFNMWNGDVGELIAFLKSIEDGSIVLMATFDDPATKLNDEARTLIAEFGSSYISKLKFRDNWVFVGGKKTTTQVLFEQHIKNDKTNNKYQNWPEMLVMEGCIPQMD